MYGFGGAGFAMPFMMLFWCLHAVAVLLFLYFAYCMTKSLHRIADKLDKKDS